MFNLNPAKRVVMPLLIGVSLFLPLLVRAQPQPDPLSKEPPPPLVAPLPRSECAGPPPLEFLLNEIELSDEQTLKIHRLLRDQQRDTKAYARTVHELERDLYKMEKQDGVTEAQMEEISRRLGTALAGMRVKPLRTRMALMQLLTQEQRAVMLKHQRGPREGEFPGIDSLFWHSAVQP